MPGRAALAIIAALALALAGAVLWGSLERSGRLSAIAQRDACHAASAGAVKAQEALRTQERAHYEEQAREADANHDAGLDRARVLTSHFVDVRRVQPQGDSSAAKPIDQAGDAEKPADVSPSLVVVAEPDVQAAAQWQAYGVTCHDYLMAITGQ
jgi:hypothetical protein